MTRSQEIAALMEEARAAGRQVAHDLADIARRASALADELQGLGSAIPPGVAETARVFGGQATVAADRVEAVLGRA